MNSIEKVISKALIDSDISHEEFMPVMNEKQHYFRLKQSIITKDSQLNDIGRDRLIGYDKRVVVNKILKQNKRR